jgi:hypothetical protein
MCGKILVARPFLAEAMAEKPALLDVSRGVWF